MNRTTGVSYQRPGVRSSKEITGIQFLTPESSPLTPDMSNDVCYRALCARDARFDGIFFVGVTTTGIYCRPVCTARTPKQDRCQFFSIAAAAESNGFRPCLRCRPELAPGHSSVDAVGRVARAAAARIEAGALNEGRTLEDLAAEFGLSGRQLRRVMRQEMGVSPVKLIQTHRLLLAKRLLTETRLPVIDIAFASGFGSLRRFNALFRTHYRLPPSRIRLSMDGLGHGEPIRLQLSYRSPFAWKEMLRFFADRVMTGVEWVSGDCYFRTVGIGSHRGWLKVGPATASNALGVEFAHSLAPVIAVLFARLRQVFDLNARPDVIASYLKSDKRIGQAVVRCPGLRVPGSFNGFDLAWRAVIGQQISVRAANAVATRFAAEFGEPIETPYPQLNRLTPLPERIAETETEKLVQLEMIQNRADTIRQLARAAADGQLCLEPGVDAHAAIEQLRTFPGIGDWTAQYIAMRALSWPDAFPHGDIGLLHGMGLKSPSKLLAIAEAWRPWRAYGAMHVWNTLIESKGRTRV